MATCLSEIIRISAPNLPYDDDIMMEVFQLIVSTFEELAVTSSRSHHNRISILKIMAEVRSFVIILDLECIQLII